MYHTSIDGPIDDSNVSETLVSINGSLAKKSFGTTGFQHPAGTNKNDALGGLYTLELGWQEWQNDDDDDDDDDDYGDEDCNIPTATTKGTKTSVFL